MSLPFFKCGASRLDEIVNPGMLCAFDFDGTLAPIVKEPELASIPAAVSRRLMLLAEHVQVAIITGRSIEDIRVRLDFLPDYVVGNHGIEGVPGWETRADSFRQLCLDWEQRLVLALKGRAYFDPGIRIENKGYSLSVHYRMAEDHEECELQLRQLFANLLPDVHVIGGKCVFNLMPSSTINKGTALERVIEASGASGVLYVGDDLTDEAAFSLGRKDLLSVRVEQSADTAAEFYLNHRLEMVPLLDELLNRLGEARSAARA